MCAFGCILGELFSFAAALVFPHIPTIGDLINQLKVNQRGPVRLMDEVSKALPDLLWLDRMECRGNSISLTGKALNPNAVANLLTAGQLVSFDFYDALTPVSRVSTNQAKPRPLYELLKAAQKQIPFRLMNPSVIESSSAPDSSKPIYSYRISDGHKAVRLVFRTAGGAYWGVQETNWPDAPVLSDRSFRHNLGGREFDFHYNGPKLHMIVLRQGDVSYWVVNSLLDNISNETMIAIAKGLQPLGHAKGKA